jgi:hypothetical protein
MRHTSRIEQAVGKRKKGGRSRLSHTVKVNKGGGGPALWRCHRRLCLVAAGTAPRAVRLARLRGYSRLFRRHMFYLIIWLCFQARLGVGESSTIHRTAVKGVCTACIQHTMAVSLQPATVPPSKGPAPHTSSRTSGQSSMCNHTHLFSSNLFSFLGFY